MEKVRGIKLITFILTLIVLVMSLASIFAGIFKVENKDNGLNDVSGAVSNYDGQNAYVIPSTLNDIEAVVELEEYYNSYTYFRINNIGAFWTFKQYLLEYGTIDNEYSRGRCFQNKVVFLTADLNWHDTGGVSYSNYSGFLFTGTFDGQGHYINFYNPSTGRGYENTVGAGGKMGCLFDKLSSTGTVKNLKICYVNVSAESGATTNNTILGGIVGLNEGTIDSCIVSYCHFMSHRVSDRCYVAPICGENNGVVSNCIVEGEYSLDCDKNKGVRGYRFVALGSEASTSVFQVNNGNATKINANGDIKTPRDIDTALSKNNNQNSVAMASANFPSSVMNGSVNGTTAWYKYPDAYGTTMLRAFITWRKIHFDCNGDGTFETVKICPSEGLSSEVSNITNNLSFDKITLIFDCEQQVVAVVQAGKVFNGWEETNESRHYKATFRSTMCTIKFSAVENTNMQEEETYNVVYGSSIRITLTVYAGNASKYSKILFSFTDSNGDYVEVEYQVDNQHYLTWSGETTKTINTNFEFTVGVQLKTYGSQFG